MKKHNVAFIAMRVRRTALEWKAFGCLSLCVKLFVFRSMFMWRKTGRGKERII